MLDLSDDQRRLTELTQHWDAAIRAIAAGEPALPLWHELQSLKHAHLLSEASAKVSGGGGGWAGDGG